MLSGSAQAQTTQPSTQPATSPGTDIEKIEPEQEPVALTIRPGHPRVLVGPDELKLIRRRAQTTHQAEFNSLLQLAEKTAAAPATAPATAPASGPTTRRAGRQGGPSADLVWRLAFLYLLTGDKAHGKLATTTLVNSLKVPVNGRYGYAGPYMKALGCAYDWLHDLLDDATREEVAGRALQWCRSVYISKEVDPREYFYGHYFNQIPYVMMATLAIADEYQAPRSLGLLQNAVWRLNRSISGQRYFLESSCFPMSYPYTSTYIGELPYLFQCSDVALGTRLFAESRWMANIVPWWTYALRDDESFVRFGDYFNGQPLFGNPFYFRIFATIASRYNDAQAQWWVNRFHEQGNEVDRIIFEERENAPEPQDLETLPRQRFFDRMGTAVSRGDFASGTLATFKCSPIYLHNHCHRDANSFTIYHKGDQALDTGAYDAYETPHWANYYIRSIAHNTIVVHDSTEKMISRDKEYANDGGQRFVNDPYWQPRTYEDLFRPEFADGQVLAYREGRDWSYVCGDASRCYSDAKLKAFLRHVVFVQDWPTAKCVSLIVLDDVEVARDGLVPRWLLHTGGKTAVDGSRILSSDGKGRLTTTVLLPQAPKIELIGGPGHDFWVDGKNYPPRDGGTGPRTQGLWRAELSPTDAGRRTRFLTMLVPADIDAPAEQPAKLEETPSGLVIRQGELSVTLTTQSTPVVQLAGRNIVVKLARPIPV